MPKDNVSVALDGDGSIASVGARARVKRTMSGPRINVAITLAFAQLRRRDDSEPHAGSTLVQVVRRSRPPASPKECRHTCGMRSPWRVVLSTNGSIRCLAGSSST